MIGDFSRWTQRWNAKSGNALMGLCQFGDHALHYLYPTLDSGILPALYDDFFQTLKEFGAECQFYPWLFDTITGQLQQMARIEPNKLNAHERYLLRHGKH